MRFSLGQVVMTAGVNGRIADSSKFSKFVMDSFKKYVNCQWGDLCDEDKEMNDSAVKNNDDRIFAKYTNEEDESIYIITEWDRSATTILFPDEY